MGAQILRRLRSAVPLDVWRRSDERAPRWSQAPRDEARISQGTDAYRHVDAFLERVDEAVAQNQLDAQLRVARHELGHRVAEVEDAERHWRVDLEDAARLVVQPRDLNFRFLDIGQDRHAALVIGEARLGGRYAPRRAIEQPRAQELLQLHDRLANRRAG